MKEKLRKIYKVKNFVFFAVLGVLSIVGMLWFLRPDESQIEKRKLTEFPKLTFAGLLDGSFTSGVDKWYSDTYPLREKLISGSYKLKSLYGDRSEQIIIDHNQGEEIPSGKPSDAPETSEDPSGSSQDPSDDPSGPSGSESPDASGSTQGPSAPTEPTSPSAPTEPTDEPKPSDKPTPTGEVLGSIYLSGDSAYSLYYFSKSPVERYAQIVNRAHQLLGDGVGVYSLIAPLGSAILLDDSLLSAIGASDQRAAIEYMNSCMDPGVHALNVYDALKLHSSEYIYFRTDHHWTALGAYYAYVEFCHAKGVEPHSLDQFKRREFPGFLGTFYSETRSSAMKGNPDTVVAYEPFGTNDMTFTQTDGQVIAWNIIMDASIYDTGNKYYCFSGSDQPYAYAHNPQITDGSACIVVKDSFGNAFVPFLIDHYEYVYWIDFRYYGGKLTDLAREKNATDVIFCFNIYNPTSDGALSSLQYLLP